MSVTNPALTVLLTARSPALLGNLQRDLPNIDARVIGPDLPSHLPGGPLYCFIDWLLPEESGLEMVRRLREFSTTRHGHITMILEAADPEDKRRALRAGADDYLLGPLDAVKLSQRLRAYAGQTQAAPSSGTSLRHGVLTVDRAAHQARVRGSTIQLRPNEFRLLVHFLSNPDRLFARHELISEIGKDAKDLDERTVDVWIGRLRRALRNAGAPDPLRTVRALGYVLDSLSD
jgi:two-component system, OmpR family, phosphate regulon response regulator PhoB